MMRISLTGLTAASKDLSVVANNLANANTTGFKKSNANFADLMSPNSAIREAANSGHGAMVSEIRRSTDQGAIKQTDSTLDLSLQGQGYLVFGESTANQTGAGETYSRAGKLTLDANGFIVDDSGAPLMGNPALNGGLQNPNLQAINVVRAIGGDPAKLASIAIDQRGLVTATTADGQAVPVSYVAVARFENSQGLQSLTGTKLAETQDSGAAQFGRAGTDGFGEVSQGTLELSNVDITSELMRMIQSQQAYNGNSRALQTDSEMLRNLTEQLD